MYQGQVNGRDASESHKKRRDTAAPKREEITNRKNLILTAFDNPERSRGTRLGGREDTMLFENLFSTHGNGNSLVSCVVWIPELRVTHVLQQNQFAELLMLFKLHIKIESELHGETPEQLTWKNCIETAKTTFASQARAQISSPVHIQN